MKFLVLENGPEDLGLPDELKDVLDINDIPYDVWYWFSIDVNQEPKETMERFATLDKDTFLITHPSFVGLGNSFESKLRLFQALMEKNIKVNIGVLYYSDFYWFLIKWLHAVGAAHDSQKRKNKEIQTLKKCLEFHEIYTIPYDTAYMDEVPVLECRKRITWKWLEENYFKRSSWVVFDGKKRRVSYIGIDDSNPEKSYVALEKELPKDGQLNMYP